VIEYATIPTVTSPTATSIGSTGATLGANVTADGGATLTARGTCWDITATPRAHCTAEGGTSTGVYTMSVTGLPSGTLIYYAGYATNSIGTGYSADGTFTTLAAPTSGLTITRDFSIRSGTEQIVSNNVTYTRSFSVQNVNRDACGSGSISSGAPVACSGTTGILEDPSTQQIIVTVSWPIRGGSNTSTATFTQYFSRTADQVMKFIDWSGGTTTSVFTQPTNQYTSQTGLNVSATGAIQLQ